MLPLTTQLVRTTGRRLYSSAAASENSFVAEREAIKHHAASNSDRWKKISIYGCIPILLLAGANSYRLAVEHSRHVAEHGPEEFVAYPYMNWRVKAFPWGSQALFFNPEVNHEAPEM